MEKAAKTAATSTAVLDLAKLTTVAMAGTKEAVREEAAPEITAWGVSMKQRTKTAETSRAKAMKRLRK